MRSRLLSFTLLSLLAFPSLASITGVVMTRDGQPLASAKVSIDSLETADARRARLTSTTPERTPLASTQADARGIFTLDSPQDPVVELRVEAKGFAPSTTRVERGEDVGAVALSRAEVKQGTIAADGKPVAGATVIWMAGENEVVATTDQNGRYSAPDPMVWATRVIVLHRDFAPIDETSGPFAPPSRKKLDRTLDPGVALKGHVVAPDGQSPAAKAMVSVDGFPLATSADDGSFTLAHAPKKWDSIEVRSGDFVGVRTHTHEAWHVLKLAKGATVGGTVRDAKTQVPLAGAEVRVGRRGPLDGPLAVSAITDAKGNYAIHPVAPGSYQITVFRTGYAVSEASASLAAGQSSQKPFVATPLARISGTVLDEDKRPVAAAAVAAQPVSRDPIMMVRGFRGGGGGLTYSGPDGRFVARTDGDADVQVEATKKGFPSAKSNSFRISAGERKSGVVITIPRGIAITGRVTDRDGKPLSGVAVSAAESEGFTGGIRRVVMNALRQRDEDAVQTASDGTFTIRLKEGTYDLAFKREGYAIKSVRGEQVNATTKPVEVTLDRGVEIAGRVVRSGSGVEGVNVFAITPESQASAVTGPAGTFTLSDLTPGSMMVNFSKPDDFIQQMRSITAPARDVLIEIPAGGRISGRVLDKATHQPVTSFQAGLSGTRGGGGFVFAGPPQMRSFTSDDGSFALEGVQPGQLTLVVQAPGYTETRVPSITVEESKTVANIEVELDRGVRVTGHVTGPDGAPLSGARVSVDSGVRIGGGMVRVGADQSVATTDANGDYALESVEGGEQTLNFAYSGLLPEQKSVQLSGREARVDVQLSSGLRVGGQVITEAGVPVPDASVRASSAAAGGFGRSTRTEADGMFQFDGLAPGRYSFFASKSGFADGSLRDVDIAADAPIRVVMKTGGVIYGHVSGLSESELANATVMARGATGSASAAIDSAGNYRIEGAPTGTVRVNAESRRGIGERRSSPMKSAQLDAGGSIQVDLEFPTDTVIRGRVRREGKPLGGAVVSFNPRGATAQTNASSTTDDSGSYSISGLADAAYNVSVVDLQRITPYTTSYDVHGSGTFDIDIHVSQVRGRVVDAISGEAVPGAIVQLRKGSGPEAMFGLRAAESDSAGNFVVESVTPGTYSATASKQGYGNEVREVIVGESSSEPIEFKLSRNDGVTVRVIDARDRRLLSATIVVYDAQNRVVHEEFFRFGGTVEALRLDLAPGQYRATVGAIGYASRNVYITSPSEQVVELTPGGALAIRSKGSALRRARLVDASGAFYVRSDSRSPLFWIDASPGTTTLQNIAPGTYALQLLGDNDVVVGSQMVTVLEGQTAVVEM